MADGQIEAAEKEQSLPDPVFTTSIRTEWSSQAGRACKSRHTNVLQKWTGRTEAPAGVLS